MVRQGHVSTEHVGLPVPHVHPQLTVTTYARHQRVSPLPCSTPRCCREYNFEMLSSAMSDSEASSSEANRAMYHCTSPTSSRSCALTSGVTMPSLSRRIFFTLLAISPASPASPRAT